MLYLVSSNMMTMIELLYDMTHVSWAHHLGIAVQGGGRWNLPGHRAARQHRAGVLVSPPRRLIRVNIGLVMDSRSMQRKRGGGFNLYHSLLCMLASASAHHSSEAEASKGLSS